jgi:hypothetical protein
MDQGHLLLRDGVCGGRNARATHQTHRHTGSRAGAGTIASKRPLAECTPFIPEILSNRGPFSSTDLFRWHPLEANGISRFRLYKEGQVAFELETDTLKQELLLAINIYTADLRREA